MAQTRAFTIIELLVVVTIIVVLLALLTPAMDRAIYQAELAVCGSRLKSIATTVTTYAIDHQRSYPYRPAAHAENGFQPVILKFNAYDDRPTLRPYMAINGTLEDPLCAEVDLDQSPATRYIFSGYDLWFGFVYTGRKGMTRLGSSLEWGRDINLLASDYDIVQDSAFAVGSHPDRDNIMTNVPFDTAADTYSQWAVTGTRGLIDMNFAYDDGAVVRLNGLPSNPNDDERMIRIPYTKSEGATAPGTALSIGTHIPN